MQDGESFSTVLEMALNSAIANHSQNMNYSLPATRLPIFFSSFFVYFASSLRQRLRRTWFVKIGNLRPVRE
ncbi:MAG: hypothetical protein DSM106950_36580 [Stigonema ocellatum SAG 48.90 = DSM 106950]|nr:hypothetical protein [Stigonema ocellatum SAG 48.90 = DSM 106950]